MTRSNLFELFIEDLEMERITFHKLRAWIRQRVEVLGLDLKDTQLKNYGRNIENNV